MCDTCELCSQSSAVFCLADEAKLCWTCDADVHGANFLVARHMRSLLCQYCGGETDCQTSGSHPTPLARTCAACSPAYGQEAHLHDAEVPLPCETKVVERNAVVEKDGQISAKRHRNEVHSSHKIRLYARQARPSKLAHLYEAPGLAKESRECAGVTSAAERTDDACHAGGEYKMRKGRAKRLKSPISVMSLSMSSGATTDYDNAVESSDLTDITEGSSSPPVAGCLKLFS